MKIEGRCIGEDKEEGKQEKGKKKNWKAHTIKIKMSFYDFVYDSFSLYIAQN